MTDLTKNQAWQMVKRLSVVAAVKGVGVAGHYNINDAENEEEFNKLFSSLYAYFHSQEDKQ